MVVDPDVTKVIVVSDKAYAEKADNRKGGVGTNLKLCRPRYIEVLSKQNLWPWCPS